MVALSTEKATRQRRALAVLRKTLNKKKRRRCFAHVAAPAGLPARPAFSAKAASSCLLSHLLSSTLCYHLRDL